MKPLARFLGAVALAAPIVYGAAAQAETTLRLSAVSDLKIVDPIFSTGYESRDFGYMIYDTLFAMDEDFVPQPQMVGDYSLSDDGLTYTFTLRDGLAWHEGGAVTTADVIPSIKRWGARDGMGQKLMEFTKELVAVDDKTFKLVLTEPYGLVLQSLGKISSNVPFIMPKEVAETDPHTQVTSTNGSGPFRLLDWRPGDKVIFVRNEDYVPRDEPPSQAAGGKIAKVDRVEWIYMPDPSTAVNALIAGEIDYVPEPSFDLLPILNDAEDVDVKVLDPVGVQGWLRTNHLYPPFDNPKGNEALLWLIDQENYLQAVIGNAEYYSECPAMFVCGTPLSTDVGAAPLMGQDVEKAKQLFKEAGYDGSKIILLQPTDEKIVSGAILVTAQALRDAGLDVEVQAMDWSTFASRRAMQEAPDDGGWNILSTWWNGVDLLNPIMNQGVNTGCVESAWFGWPCDEEIEKMRNQFALEQDPAKQADLAARIQERAFEIGAYVPYGQWAYPVAYREEVTGLIPSAVPFVWNISKE